MRIIFDIFKCIQGFSAGYERGTARGFKAGFCAGEKKGLEIGIEKVWIPPRSIILCFGSFILHHAGEKTNSYIQGKAIGIDIGFVKGEKKGIDVGEVRMMADSETDLWKLLKYEYEG